MNTDKYTLLRFQLLHIMHIIAYYIIRDLVGVKWACAIFKVK